MPVKPPALDEDLLAERLAEFEPEPLVKLEDLKSKEELEIPAIEEDENTIDLAKTNFLNVLNNDDIKKACENTIRKYGVGTCGPRAFYGTTDVHLELEEAIAKFLNMEESIVYAYGFVAISSSIAAYCKKNDIVFTDTNCNVAIQQGLQMAKSKVIYFDHQRPETFAQAVEEAIQNEKKSRAKCRKFLIVEGVSWKTGKIINLPEFLKVTEEHKIRVFLEETYSFGILGENGRGLMDYYNIEPWRLDMVIGTLEAAIGSIGGFCAGSQIAIEHQRLSGSGYIFSASLPTFLVQACIESIALLAEKPHLKLQKLSQNFHETLEEMGFDVESDPISPFKVFHIKDKEMKKSKEHQIHDFCKYRGLHFIENELGLVINLNVTLFDDQSRYDNVEAILKEALKSLE